MCTSCFEHRHKAVGPPPSPSLHEHAVVLEQFADEDLREVVGSLVAGGDLDQLKLIGMCPEPMPFIQEVPGAVGNPMV